jgi:hypothetical protein
MKLEQARFPQGPSEGFTVRVLSAARSEPRLKQPSLLPEILDGLGWAAAMWVGGFLLREFFR